MMRGPYLLRPLQVDISVPTRVGGVYCLAKEPRKVSFIGRADRDLRDTIKTHWQEYRFFWYELAVSAREGFVRHCYAYHKHEDNGLERKEHPAAPDNSELKCPVCGK